MLANKSMVAAVVCIMKYLIVASIARGLYFWVIKGIIANVLISRPIHARSQ